MPRDAFTKYADVLYSKMRILLAFLALDQISEKDVVMDLLNQADNDSDQVRIGATVPVRG